MKQVIIPLCNVTLNMNPIAFSIWGIPIYWYAILIVASILLALLAYYKSDGKYGIHYDDIIDLALILIPISFVCARIYYVLFHFNDYTTFQKIINIKDGGLAIYGGILGGAITSYLFCKKRKISFWDLADYLVPYVSLRTSNWKMGEFYQCRGIWKSNQFALENGNPNRRNDTICTSYFSL